MIDEFVREFLDATQPNPMANFEHVWQWQAAFELRAFGTYVHLGSIRSLVRGKGYGSAALDWLCELADRHEVTIRGHIEPNGLTRPRLNFYQLRAWYKRHGFTVNEWDNIEYKGVKRGTVCTEHNQCRRSAAP